MNGVWIIERVQFLEAHDDFCSDYTGELCEIFRNEFYASADDAWNAILDNFSGEEPEYVRIDAGKRELDWKHADDDWWTFRIKELKPAGETHANRPV